MFLSFSPYRLEKFYAWTAALSLSVIVVCFLGLNSDLESAIAVSDAPKNQGIQVQFIESAPLSSQPAKPTEEVVSIKAIKQETPPTDLKAEILNPTLPQSLTNPLLAHPSPVNSSEPLLSGGSPTLVPAKFTPQEGGQFPDPLYPRWARQQNIQGSLMLLVTVQAEGRVGAIRVTESSGNAKLDAFAMDWVRQQWIWPPGSIRSFLVPFVFQLK